MAGQFVLWKISQATINTYVNAGVGVVWSGLAHGAGVANGAGGFFAGWTPVTRDEINRVRSAVLIGNRNNVPPHRYLQFPPGVPVAGLAALLLNDKYGWIAELQRPDHGNVGGFGMVALCPAADALWNANDKHGALLAQINHGATSVECYYLGSKEMS